MVGGFMGECATKSIISGYIRQQFPHSYGSSTKRVQSSTIVENIFSIFKTIHHFNCTILALLSNGAL